LKEWAGRERPAGIRIRDHVDSFGFPSGHSACAFAIAGVIASQLPKRWRPVAYGLAACAGLGRMHMGSHYLLDVVGGALVGLAAAHLLVAITAVERGHEQEVHDPEVHEPGERGQVGKPGSARLEQNARHG
jgi:undecaprenyl-diphosphatase